MRSRYTSRSMSCDFTGSMMTDRTMESVDSMYSSMRSPLPSGHSSDADMKLRQAQALAANPENLNELSYSKLVTLNAEMEQLIQVYNESLVDELAHRDELEYEKEMKNTFISLLLSIQNKRRQFVNERKRKGIKVDPHQLPQFMTASIPYNDHQHMDNATLSSLIKSMLSIFSPFNLPRKQKELGRSKQVSHQDLITVPYVW
ncbi:unnamed protein product [Haemonchus placei]|uniref:FEZ-like protein n=1 Tax=Haemonchus placei TaxID=6290 RepID=A0A0N4WM25_HAEPC|nr:unnamed protein product [Haemonchus placei]